MTAPQLAPRGHYGDRGTYRAVDELDDDQEMTRKLGETPRQRRWRDAVWVCLLVYAGGSGVYVAVEAVRWVVR